jgi:hypothetical protein
MLGDSYVCYTDGNFKGGEKEASCLTAVWLQPLHIGAKFLTLRRRHVSQQGWLQRVQCFTETWGPAVWIHVHYSSVESNRSGLARKLNEVIR